MTGLLKKHFLALQAEIIAIKNACGPGYSRYFSSDCYYYPAVGKQWPRYYNKQETESPDDKNLKYETNIQNFASHIVRGGQGVGIHQKHSYRATAYQVAYNIAEIFIDHIKSNINDELSLISNILINLEALKNHRYNPSSAGNAYMSQERQWMLTHPQNISYFIIKDDVGMYLLAKRLHYYTSFALAKLVTGLNRLREVNSRGQRLKGSEPTLPLRNPTGLVAFRISAKLVLD